jgi:soluble lytic murein transglycosylase-like protein
LIPDSAWGKLGTTTMKTIGEGIFTIFLALLLFPAVISAASEASLRDRYDPLIREIAERHLVDPALVHSIIAAESGYNRFAVSTRGALGIMQLMPETAKDYAVENVFDAEQNIEGGVKYLKDLLALYASNTELVLAAYNAGRKAVMKYGGIPPYGETREYVERVKASLRKLSATKRTQIFAFRDSEGHLCITNDLRLASASGARPVSFQR